jgi:hypothetical protein
MVRRVRVEAPLDRAGRQLKRLTTGPRLDGLEVQTIDRAWAYERLDLGRDLGREGFLEAPFFAVSCEAASSAVSAHCSQASQ